MPFGVSGGDQWRRVMREPMKSIVNVGSIENATYRHKYYLDETIKRIKRARLM